MFQGSICPKQLLNSQHQGVAFSRNSHFNSQISEIQYCKPNVNDNESVKALNPIVCVRV